MKNRLNGRLANIFVPGYVTRLILGIPLLWATFWQWITFSGNVALLPVLDPGKKERKHLLIPLLEDYQTAPSDCFWNNFPENPIPKKVSSPLDISELEALIKDRKELMTNAEVERQMQKPEQATQSLVETAQRLEGLRHPRRRQQE